MPFKVGSVASAARRPLAPELAKDRLINLFSYIYFRFWHFIESINTVRVAASKRLIDSLVLRVVTVSTRSSG